MIKVRCPICDLEMPGQPSDWPEYPFCNPRCRKVDLGRWLSEQYRIPTSNSNEEDSSPAEDSEEDE